MTDWRLHLNDWSYANTVLTRLAAGISPGPGDCWVWTRSHTQDGYGHISVKKAMIRCHQVAYHLLIGEVPEGLQFDHLCRVRACCNPWHLDVVTSAVNFRRGLGTQPAIEFNRSKTHCKQGHPFDLKNTYIRWVDGRPHRNCRRCRADGMARALRMRKGEAA